MVGYSGVTDTAKIAHDDFSNPPLLLYMESPTPLVPIPTRHIAEGELKRLGGDVTTLISYGVAHSVDPFCGLAGT